MKLIKILYLLITLVGITQSAFAKVSLSKKIFREFPFSSQYPEDGALIRSVDFKSVKVLVSQLENKYSKILEARTLEDRNEAHRNKLLYYYRTCLDV